MKKDYLFIGAAILAIGGFYWWNKNKTATAKSTPVVEKKINLSDVVVLPTNTSTPSQDCPDCGTYGGSVKLPPVLINDYVPPIQNPNVPFKTVGAFKSNGGGKSQPDVGAFNYQKLMTYANQGAPKN